MLVKMKDICTKIGSGATPKGGNNAYIEEGTALIRSQNILDFSFSYNGLAYINDEQASKLNGVTIKEDDVLLNITGDSVARACMVDNSVLPARVNQHVCIVRGNKSRVLSSFILYFLQMKKPELLMMASSGATRNALTKGMIEELEVELPSLEKQERMVSLLDNLQNKISKNNQINRNLSEQAQAVFTSWFLKFEPFNESMKRSPTGKEVPKSFEYVQINDLEHILETGKRPKGGAVSEGIPSLGAESVKGIGRFNLSNIKYIPIEFAQKQIKGKVNGYELMIYKDGGKPGEFHPNFSMFGEGYPFDDFFINEHVFKLDFGNRGYNEFAYFYFQTDYVKHWLESNGGKAAIPGINQNVVNSIWILSPNSPKVKEYCNWVQPLFTQILKNCCLNMRLSELRDSLLPKLMSGEIDLSELDN